MGLPVLLFGLAFAACPFAGSGSCDAPDSLSLLQLRLEGAACPADAATQLPTCSAELEVRRYLADKFTNRSMAREGPQFVRMVFHDAVDHNNLAEGVPKELEACRKEVKWAMDHGIKSNPEWYNNELTTASSFDDVQMYFHKNTKDKGDCPNPNTASASPPMISGGGVDACLYSTPDKHGKPDHSHNRNLPALTLDMLQRQFGCKASQPDVEVLAAAVAVEAAGGPSLPLKWGRAKGSCARITDCPFTKGTPCTSKLRIRNVPSATSFDADAWRTSFQNHGFSAEDQAALMGAHSYGKLQVCAGGFNGIERGSVCKDPEKCTRNGDFPMPGAGSFGDGGVFDLTPQTFDNNYFQLIADEDPDGDQQCCGKMTKWGGCHRSSGKPVRRDGKTPAASLCDVGFCRSDRKGRSHMKSTKHFVQPDASFVKSKHGLVKRVIRLGPDWALLKREDTRSAVRNFAQDEQAFFGAFATAFGKLAEFGADNLAPCAATECERTAGGLACGSQRLAFGDGCAEADAEGPCRLVGGHGALGRVQCGERTLLCAAGAA